MRNPPYSPARTNHAPMNTSNRLDFLGHDSDSFGVNGTQESPQAHAGIFKDPYEIILVAASQAGQTSHDVWVVPAMAITTNRVPLLVSGLINSGRGLWHWP